MARMVTYDGIIISHSTGLRRQGNQLILYLGASSNNVLVVDYAIVLTLPAFIHFPVSS